MINKYMNICVGVIEMMGVFLAESYQGDQTVSYNVMCQGCHSHASAMHKWHWSAVLHI
jgi:hypothetical protein